MQYDERHQPCQQGDRQSLGVFAEHLASDSKDISRELCVAASIAAHTSHTAAQTPQILLAIARSGDYGPSAPNARHGVGITTADFCAGGEVGHPGGIAICSGLHVAVTRFQGWESGLEEVEILDGTASGEAREYVIGAEKQPLKNRS